MKNSLKIVIGCACAAAVVVGISVLGVKNTPVNQVDCYTIGAYDKASIPSAQEDRQYRLDSYDEFVEFCDDFNVEIDDVDKSTFHDNIALVMVSSDGSGIGCELSSVYVDDDMQPHMIINKYDSDESDAESYFFIATVNKSYADDMDFSRWSDYL